MPAGRTVAASGGQGKRTEHHHRAVRWVDATVLAVVAGSVVTIDATLSPL